MTMLTPTRRGLAAGAVAALAVGVTMQASLATPAPNSPFDIDGTITTALPSLESDPEITTRFSDAFGNASELGPVNASNTKLGVIHAAPKPMLASTNPNAQVDLRNVWIGSATDDTTQEDTWLYFGWERDSNKGSGVIMYEFQQSPEPVACDYTPLDVPALTAACNPFENRQPGDFLVVWDQSGSSAVIKTRYFTLGVDTDGNGEYDKAEGDTLVLGADVPLPVGTWEARYSADKFKGEGTLNLTDTIFANSPAGCVTIGNVIPGTVTGNSDTADYKDVVLADVAESVTISSCGSVRVTKVTDPPDGTGEFDYTLAREGGDPVNYAESPALPDLELTGTLTEDGDSETLVNLREGTDYTLAEEITAGAYDLESIACTLGADDPIDVTDGGTFPVEAGQQTECVITNALQQGTLNVTKVLTNDNGGTKPITGFSFTATGQGGGAAIPFEADGTNSFTVDAGTYAVAEVGVPIAGYTTTYSPNCSAVQVPAGGSATCTITNNDQAAALTLVKQVTTNSGGDALATDWRLTATSDPGGIKVIDGATTGTPAATSPVNAGTFDLSESGPGGYSPSSWVCTAGTMPDGDTVTLALGQSATCTITNDDQPATLTLVKSVTNNDGGTAAPSAWTLNADGPTDLTGTNGAPSVTAVPVDAGTYDLSETGGPSGYAASAWVCTGTGTQSDSDTVILDEGESATCTITNDDQAGTLTVNKVLVNDNGGTATTDDFSFSVNGGTAVPFEADGSNSLPVDAGTYTVTEPAVDGYTMTSNTCTDVVVPNGGTGECTITNDDQKASPSGTTTQRWVLHDTLGIVGLRPGAGQLEGALPAEATFRLYSDAGCTVLVDEETVDVTGSAASTADGVGVEDPGTYYWRVQYSGDQFNSGFTTDCGDEVTQIFVKDHLRNNLVP